MKNYLSEIKNILESTKVYNWDMLDKFRTDDIFYFFQYPDHFVEYFGKQRWELFEKVYLGSKIKGKMNVSTRWTHLQGRHITGKRVLDLGSNIGVEVYHMRKNLFPSYTLGIEHSPPAVALAKLAFDMHKIDNVDFMVWDLINNYDNFPNMEKFDTTIMAGSLFSFEIPNSFEQFQKFMIDLLSFVKKVTVGHFYFLCLDKYHFGMIRKCFRDKKICILDTKQSRMVKQYIRSGNNYNLTEFEFERNRDEFYGYVKL